jgi:hypothetical protein
MESRSRFIGVVARYPGRKELNGVFFDVVFVSKVI